MKNYDQSVKLQKIRFDLASIEHKSKTLTNQQILDIRWARTEEALRLALPLLQKSFRKLMDDIIAMLKDIGFEYGKLNEEVSPRVKRIVNDKIESWSDSGLLQGYLQYLASTHTWTYKSVLGLLIYGLYASRFADVQTISKDVFIIAAVDAYAQANADRRRRKFKALTLAAIIAFAVMPIMANTYFDYINSLMLSMVEETESFILVNAVQDDKIDEKLFLALLIKQLNRILRINKGKYSGGLDDAARAVVNKAYVYDTPKDQQVRFIAEMDNRTTEMCRSLNDQIFNVNKKNTFKRYSAIKGGIVEVTCEGLVQGLNLPPIEDHFHWCRSTVTYQIELTEAEYHKMFGQNK